MVQKIFFSTTPNIFPKIILANSVYINAPNCHFTRTPYEFKKRGLPFVRFFKNT